MIVVNCRFLTQTLSGVQRFAEEIAGALAQKRTDLVFVAPHGDLRVDSLAGIPVQRIGRRTGHAWEQFDLPLAMRREFKGATLLSLMNTGPVMMKRQIVTHHDITYARWPQTYSARFRLGYRALSTLTLRHAERIVTVSEFSKAEIADLYGLRRTKITVVPNAVSSNVHGAVATADTHPYFLAVASHLPHKNLGFLIDTFIRHVDSTGSTSRLRLVGSRPDSFAGKERLGQVVHPQIDWLGRVSDAELGQLYAGARALVFPSLYEGFGVPPLEAQANGAAVLSSTAASLPEVLVDSALFFDPEDEQSLANALRQVENDDREVSRLRSLGQENVSRFSWDASASILSALLDDIRQ